MLKKAGTIARDVATILGEAILPDCEPEESPFPNMEEQVETLVPGILTEMLEAAPSEKLTGWKSLDRSAFRRETSGIGILPLPSDFLRLGIIRLKGRDFGIRSVLSESNPGIAKFKSGVAGVNGSCERPEAIFSLSHTGERTIEIYRCEEGAAMDYGFYLPIPGFDSSGNISIPDPLYPELIRKMAEKIERT